MIKLTHW